MAAGDGDGHGLGRIGFVRAQGSRPVAWRLVGGVVLKQMGIE